MKIILILLGLILIISSIWLLAVYEFTGYNYGYPIGVLIGGIFSLVGGIFYQQ